jgi:hypothetical protein
MFKKKEEGRPVPVEAQEEERAYEDNWYRSLKALAAQQDEVDEPDPVDEAEGPAAPVHDLDAGMAGVDAPSEPAVEPPDTAETTPTPVAEETSGPVLEQLAPPPEPVHPVDEAEIESRANYLLERLRTLQRLGDPEEDGANEETSGEPTSSVGI